MTARLRKLLSALGDVFWFLPGLMVVAGVPALDHAGLVSAAFDLIRQNAAGAPPCWRISSQCSPLSWRASANRRDKMSRSVTPTCVV